MKRTIADTGNMQQHTTHRLTPRRAHLRVLAPVAGVLLLAACGRGNGTEAEAAAPAVVAVGLENTVVAARGEIQTGPLLSGSLQAKEQATIRAEVPGTVLAVSAEEGQRVQRGQPLARIEDAEVQDAYRATQAAVSTAANAAAIAARDLERSQTLAEAGAVPTRNVEMARVQLENSRTQLAQARAQAASARQRLSNTRITAPITGVVSRRAVNAGDVVNPGAELFTVIDPASMELRASVPSEELGLLQVGTPVQFQVRGYPNQTFVGRIARIAPAADPATRQVPIFVELPNTGGTLVSGLFAEGRVAAEARSGLIVPASAVDVDGAAPTVMRVRNGRAEEVAVQLGLADPRTERVEIVSGVQPGDTLLSGAAREITPGTPVRVGRVAAPATR